MTISSLCITEGADRPTTESLIGMHEAGVDITVVCPAEHPNFNRLTDAGVPVIDLQLRKNFDAAGSEKLRTEIQRGRYDLIHTFNSKALTNGLRACRDLPVGVIAYRGIVGNVSFLDPMSWKRYLNPRIDRIVCVCDAIRRHFLAMRPAFLRMPPTRPVTIYKGHRVGWYDEPPADLSEAGIPDDAFTIACTAAYRPRKGIEYLVHSLELLPDDVPAHLVLIGDMDAPALSRRIEQSPARERIHRVGFRSNAPAWSGACDVFCLPSIKREGLARAIIEAMCCRVPPVVTDSGGSPELVVDGESGFVVPVRDAVALARAFERLYRDPALRQSMGERARERIEHDFRVEATVEQTIALYEEVASLYRLT